MRGYDGLDNDQLNAYIDDVLHLTAIHYGLWFSETTHQMGLDKAIAADAIAWKNMAMSAAKRLKLGTDLGYRQSASREELVSVLQAVAKNWLAMDGYWFQAVENNFDFDMVHAKRINDSCWMRFSYIEASLIKRRLQLPDNGGVGAVKVAFMHRVYCVINDWLIEEVDDNTIIIRSSDCLVQSGRKRNGLPDYPCVSAGKVEYPRFAEAIDPRVRVKCIGCPPGPHPDEWYCAWEFYLPPELRP